MPVNDIDVDEVVRHGLRSAPLAPPAIGDLVSELQTRVRRRRTRRRAALVTGALMVVVIAGVTTFVPDDRPRQDVVAGPVDWTLPSTPPVIEPQPFDPGPALDPETVRLPSEGIAADVEGVGVVLATLNGEVIGHLPGFDSWGGENPGPVRLGRDEEFHLLENGRVRPNPQVDGWLSTPLAYGAEKASVIDYDPGHRVVRRNGRDIFDLGNGMDSIATVSHDLDVVSVDWSDHRPSEVLDLRNGRRSTLREGCLVGDRHGPRRYLLCENDDDRPSTIRAGADTDHSPPVLLEGPGLSGGWSGVMVSPDGKQLLLSWWNRCGAPQTYVASASGGELLPVDRLLGLESSATPISPLGWAPDGTALVRVTVDDRCGPSAAAPGVYRLRPDGTTSLLLSPPTEMWTNVSMWAPALR